MEGLLTGLIDCMELQESPIVKSVLCSLNV